MDFGDLWTVRHPDGTLYDLRKAIVPGWRIGLRFYTCGRDLGGPFPEGAVLPGYIQGQRFEREPIR
jgi:hypothetical protein